MTEQREVVLGLTCLFFSAGLARLAFKKYNSLAISPEQGIITAIDEANDKSFKLHQTYRKRQSF